VLLIALAPTTQGIAVRGPFTFALQYVTHSGGSFFPLLPWSGYLFAGVVLGALAHGGSRVRSAVTLLAAGVVLIGAGALAGAWLDTTARAVSTPSNLIKLGTVSCVGGALALASLRVERLPRRLETLAGETLVIYGSHLVVLYGSGLGLLYVVGRRLGVGEAIALALVMIVLSAAVGLGWNRVKRAWRNRRRTPLADPAETG